MSVCVCRQRQPGCTSSVGVSATVNTLHTHHHVRCILNLITGVHASIHRQLFQRVVHLMILGWRRQHICYRLSLIHLSFHSSHHLFPPTPPKFVVLLFSAQKWKPISEDKMPTWMSLLALTWEKSISEIWMPFVASP